jgi:hypothetical protein
MRIPDSAAGECWDTIFHPGEVGLHYLRRLPARLFNQEEYPLNTLRAVTAAVVGFAAWPVMGMSSADEPKPGGSYRLGIVLDPVVPMSGTTVRAMRDELDRLLRPAGISPEVYLMADEVHLGKVDDLVIVSLKGCSVVPVGLPRLGKVSRLGWVVRVDGEMLSTIHVDCTEVGAHVSSALVWAQQGFSKTMMGRALARVLVHELLHYLTGSVEHSGSRLFREQVDAQTLVDPRVELETGDVAALREASAK